MFFFMFFQVTFPNLNWFEIFIVWVREARRVTLTNRLLSFPPTPSRTCLENVMPAKTVPLYAGQQRSNSALTEVTQNCDLFQINQCLLRTTRQECCQQQLIRIQLVSCLWVPKHWPMTNQSGPLTTQTRHSDAKLQSIYKCQTASP